MEIARDERFTCGLSSTRHQSFASLILRPWMQMKRAPEKPMHGQIHLKPLLSQLTMHGFGNYCRLNLALDKNSRS